MLDGFARELQKVIRALRADDSGREEAPARKPPGSSPGQLRRQQLPQNRLKSHVRLGPLNNLPHNFAVHRVMRPRQPRPRLARFNSVHIRLERVAEIHVAILVDVPVLPRLERVREFPVRRFRQVNHNALPAVAPQGQKSRSKGGQFPRSDTRQTYPPASPGSAPLQSRLCSLNGLDFPRHPLRLVFVLESPGPALPLASAESNPSRSPPGSSIPATNRAARRQSAHASQSATE